RGTSPSSDRAEQGGRSRCRPPGDLADDARCRAEHDAARGCVIAFRQREHLERPPRRLDRARLDLGGERSVGGLVEAAPAARPAALLPGSDQGRAAQAQGRPRRRFHLAAQLEAQTFLSTAKDLVGYPSRPQWSHGVFSCVDGEICTHSPNAKAVPATKTGHWVIEGSSTHGENPATIKLSILCLVESQSGLKERQPSSPA